MRKRKVTPLDFPVIEFRPLPGHFAGDVRRYADGRWLLDDGEYDLAFIGDAAGSFRAPICLMFEPPYQRNIIWSWKDGDWRENNWKHPRGNPWHHALREGETEWGGDWGRDRHPNCIAGRAGMTKRASETGCSNGLHVEFREEDAHIAAGLVRERDTKRILTLPEGVVCMYCGDVFTVKARAPA